MDRVEAVTKALVVLARMNIPTDVQELLVSGNPSRDIAPGALSAAIAAIEDGWEATWPIGLRVSKLGGSEWHGRVVGHYSTHLTPQGVAVESECHRGSVQIYPCKALYPLPPPPEGGL